MSGSLAHQLDHWEYVVGLKRVWCGAGFVWPRWTFVSSAVDGIVVICVSGMYLWLCSDGEREDCVSVELHQ